MSSPQRLKRINQLLRQEISQILRTELPERDLELVTIPEVRVSGDLKTAHVFVSAVGPIAARQRAAAILTAHRRQIQHLIGSRIRLRETPHLLFVADEAIERGDRVLRILEELEREPPSPGPASGEPDHHG